LNQPTDEHTSFLIWDYEGAPPKGKWIPILWKSYGESGDLMHSIPRLVEVNANALRERYLAWIYELGESNIKGKRLVDHLELRPGFSYWWMTWFAEKSNVYKSFQIIDVLKLLVIEELVGTVPGTTIILNSDNGTLAQIFRIWCENVGMAFEWIKKKRNGGQESWGRSLYRSLFYPIHMVILLTLYIWHRWPLKQQKMCQNIDDSADITFVDYLFHLDQKALTTGRFVSNYWTDLISTLDHSGLKINWIHHYIFHDAVSSSKQACDLIARFNQNERGRHSHVCLDGTLSISVVLAALIDYCRIVWMSLRLNKIKHQFFFSGSRLNFWPLFRQDWRNSMFSSDAILNCLILNQFERVIKQLPYQKLGIYLQENQSWEMALIYAWRAAGHGRLIGAPHATVRYWDLRYFYDSRSYSRTNRNDLPMPDQVALNGPAALRAYREGGYPENQMVEVEALRYLYLANQLQERTETEGNAGVLRVLVLGDYLTSATHQQMQWMEAAAQNLPASSRYTVKPHPACAIEPKKYTSLKMHITNDALSELLTDCDVVFTSDITSAAVDAYCAGIPVVSVLDGNSFNVSPLRGIEGVIYVTNPIELAAALLTAPASDRVVAAPYFCLDKGLLRWRKLLGLSLTETKAVEA